jgi:hypothetical protein
MIPVPTSTKIWLAGGVTDMMGWTPPFAQRQTAGLAGKGE